MNFSTEEINEFKAEALELLDDAERSLLALDAGALLKNHYDSIFRVFHSLKGGAGMLGLTPVQSHMHQLETQYQKLKGTESIAKELITYFLKGVDAARQLLEGKNISFDYSESEATKSEIKPETKTDSVIETKSLATVPSNNRQNAPAPLGDRPRIFVIDDEKDIVDILSEAIQEAGFEPIGFTNPIEAIQNLKKFKPDAVLTDMKMPEASGFEVLQTVRQLNDELPVIFISGHMTKEMVLDAIHKGAFSILEKPFSIANVIAVSSNAVHRSQLVKLLNNTISFLYYQYSDIDQFLAEKGNTEIRTTMNAQFKTLIETRRNLKTLNKKAKTDS